MGEAAPQRGSTNPRGDESGSRAAPSVNQKILTLQSRRVIAIEVAVATVVSEGICLALPGDLPFTGLRGSQRACVHKVAVRFRKVQDCVSEDGASRSRLSPMPSPNIVILRTFRHGWTIGVSMAPRGVNKPSLALVRDEHGGRSRSKSSLQRIFLEGLQTPRLLSLSN